MTQATSHNPSLTIVVPVFNAHDCLVDCLDALDHCSPDAAVVVVDDASDDPRIGPLLRHWTQHRANAEILSLPRNRGFVHAANQGASLAGGDVVLLNSDTVVTTGWFEALHRCLASDPAIATATPWSNNAEIVSVPVFCAANPAPKEPERWAQAARNSTTGDYPELPTAVGFCMAIAGEAIATLGLFDEAAFGRGYGEENDFCRRAVSAGWRNVLCEDAFVVHQGGQSFGPLGLKPGTESMERLLGKHPDYLDLVSAWIKEDPLAARRQGLLNAFDDLERDASGTLQKPLPRE